MQYVVTPAAGKRLIGKAVAKRLADEKALRSGTVVIVAGTTNGYVAEETLAGLGQAEDFSRQRFFRGITLPPASETTDEGRLPDDAEFPGDVVLVNGEWQRGKTVFDVSETMKKGDVIVKGANAVNVERGQAGVLIGHPQGGTIVAALQASIGRRVRLILPVGLEKRVSSDLNALATRLNVPGVGGPRLLPAPGEIVTEIEALSILTGARAELVAAGGVGGAEGAVWLAVTGTDEQERAAKSLMDSVTHEGPFEP